MLSFWLLLVALSAIVSASNITDIVFGNIKEGIVAAFGDFNSDELTDIFVIRDNKKTLQILFGTYAYVKLFATLEYK